MKKMIITIFIGACLITGYINLAIIGPKNAATLPAIPRRESAPIDLKANIDLNLRPNEAGQIMVLMYHNIGKQESEWVRTPANFRKDLTTLYEKGYRPISLTDYVTGNINTEPGFTPLVITFDDGNMNNFAYLENGLISLECAVGILIDFHATHEDFPLEATFFLTGERPFQQTGLERTKLRFIIANGMDIGNHTRDHANFTKSTGEEIQAEIGAQAQYLQARIGRDDYAINTLALPYGSRPRDNMLTKYLAEGSFQGVAYANIAVLNVGANPGCSPYDLKFDHLNIPRIRASEMKVDNVGLYDYLAYFDRNPQERFISDGAAGIITIPEEKREFLATFNDKEVYSY